MGFMAHLLFKHIAADHPVALYLATTNSATVTPNGLRYPSLADASLNIGENLVSLALIQLSVSNALFHLDR